MEYNQPPFSITNEMLSYVASVSEKLGRISIAGQMDGIGSDTAQRGLQTNMRVGDIASKAGMSIRHSHFYQITGSSC